MGLEIDPAFFQDPDHRPKPVVVEDGGIPLIDLSSLISSENNPDAAADASETLAGLLEEVEAACTSWGFFRVVNHGVPAALLERLQAAARAFFALPPEEKRRVSRDAVNPFGYYDTEHTKNVRDWKEVFDYMVEEEPADGEPGPWRNQWPAYPPDLRDAAMVYARAVEKLAFALLHLISLALGLPATRLDGFFRGQSQSQPSSTFVRLNHYPPCPAPDLALGVGRHKDAGALTVLAQDDVGGLDVKRKSDGEWIRVKPIPNSYIINVGDIIQVWSNDRYESAEHRVSVNPGRERFSVPFFFNPALSAKVRPLEELTDELNPSRYEAYDWGVFFRTRKNSNFGKLAVENIQISHFRKKAR